MEQRKQTDENNDLLETNPFQTGDENTHGRGNGQPSGNTPKKFNMYNIIIVLFLINFLFNFLAANLSGRGVQIEYSQFIRLVESGYVSRVQIGDEIIQLELMENVNYSEVERILFPQGRSSGFGQQLTPNASNVITTVRIDDPALVERLSGHNVDFYKPKSRNSPILSFILSWVMPKYGYAIRNE